MSQLRTTLEDLRKAVGNSETWVQSGYSRVLLPNLHQNPSYVVDTMPCSGMIFTSSAPIPLLNVLKVVEGEIQSPDMARIECDLCKEGETFLLYLFF